MSFLIKLTVVCIIIFLFLTAGPWCFIWAINTLIAAAMVGAPAGTFIPYISFTFWTWLSALVLGGLVIAPVFRASR